MFATQFSAYLKPHSLAEFNRTIENEVIPLLRKQKGFKDEITFVTPNEREAVGISLWDQKESAEAYNRTTFPQVLDLLARVADETPQVKTFEVSHSTFHKINARVAVQGWQLSFLRGTAQPSPLVVKRCGIRPCDEAGCSGKGE